MNKVCIVNGGMAYNLMFEDRGWEVVFNVEEANLVQFCGGADVDPAYYGELKHPQTYSNKFQDMEEMELFLKCKKLGKRMAGICRGGQFLHVMNGGDMWQHVQHHAIHGTHGAYDVRTDQFLPVTSTHHQMMRESDNGLTVLVGDGVEPARKEHMIANGDIESVKCDVDLEAVYYEETKCFCFQPHPEFIYAQQCRNYYFNKLNEFFGLE
jgi:carbamoylphosphate synthase small subunit